MKHFLAFLGMLTAFSPAANAALIKIDGSSTVFPVTEAVSEEFQTEKKGEVQLTVGISGTGGGFKKFCRGETDLQNASRPITKSEMEDCRKEGIRYFELPVGFDAIAIVVNPKNDWVKSLSLDDLKKIRQPEANDKIKSWQQVNSAWPKEDLKLFGAGTDSGTFDYFTEAVNKTAKASRKDYNATEDDNTTVQGVSTNKGALGFIPLAYFENNSKKLKLVAIAGGEKAPKKNQAILPNKKTVVDGSYFPLSRPIFIYVKEASFKKPEVKEFVEYYLKHAPKLVEEVHYIPLPQKAYDIAADHLKKNKLGTVFAGEPQVGLTIEEILKKEAKEEAKK